MQTCAALGREFSYALVRAVMQDRPTPSSSRCSANWSPRSSFTSEGCRHTRSYVFKHALVQDAAYETMLLAQRKAVHRRIVEVCESAFPEISRSATPRCWPTMAPLPA